jgi:hypothetical protein
MASWEEFKATLRCVNENAAFFQQALLALVTSNADPSNTFAAYREKQTHVVNNFALLGVKDNLRYVDLNVPRGADVIEDIAVEGRDVRRTSVMYGSYDEVVFDDTTFGVNAPFILMTALQYQEVKVRVYFDAAALEETGDHEFSLEFTGLVLNTDARKHVALHDWDTRSHRYSHGMSRNLE